jgi:hypothetical protein
MHTNTDTSKSAIVAQILNDHGIKAEVVGNSGIALARIHELVPAGAKVMTNASTTLKEIGLEAELGSGGSPWNWLKPAIGAENDPAKRSLLRGQASLAEYYVGSVQAVTEMGQVICASGSGSQLASYVYSSPNVIWVVGNQKVVPTLEDGIRRIRDVCVPKMAELTKSKGKPELGVLAKILIIENEMAYTGRSVHLLLVEEALGF